MAEVSTVRQAPAEFIEAAGKNYLEDLTSAVGGIKGLDVSKLYGPQFVAGPSQFQQTAETLAGGLGGYQPYLQSSTSSTNSCRYGSTSISSNICLHINKMLLIQV
jgi:hypothetical protein